MLLHATEHAPSVTCALLRSAKSNPGKILAYGGLIVLLFANPTTGKTAENTSTCWIATAATGGNAAANIPLASWETLPGTWPSAKAALDAATQRVQEQSLGKPACVIMSGSYRVDLIAQLVLHGDYASQHTTISNGVGGIPVAFQRTIEFANGNGEFCGYRYKLYTYVEAVDGSYFESYRVCQRTYTIKLSPRDGAPQSGTILSSVEPDRAVRLIARVYDPNGQLVPNANIRLESDVIAKSGGHKHPDDKRPKGKLGGTQTPPHILTGKTTGSGAFAFTFTAPAPAGDHKITASCTDGKNCKQDGPDTVWVGIRDLIPLPTNNNYVLIPNRDTNHPDNHYMTYNTQIKLMQLADFYRATFPKDPLLHINDASLERGGLFDITGNWSSDPKGHEAHRRGTEVDIRANPLTNPDSAIPERNFREFKRIAKGIEGTARIHSPRKSNQHFHVKF